MLLEVILLILFVIVCIYYIFLPKHNNVESFGNDNNKFFILQHRKFGEPINDIRTFPKNAKIGYMHPQHIEVFKNIYKVHNNQELQNFKYIKKTNYDFEKVDFLLYINDSINIENYYIIDYFMEKDLTHLKKLYFENYEFVLYNDLNRSVFVFSLNLIKPPLKLIIHQKVSYQDGYNFVLENNINGKYREINLTTNKIVLYQNKLDDLEVKIGDVILLKNQMHTFMNGIYIVDKINKYIHMTREVKVLPKFYSCIDENLIEQINYVNKYSCNHEYDYVGETKPIKMKWSARCRRNMECPFFDDDNEYGGGCENGFCKMPTTVIQTSFKDYKKEKKN